MRQHLPKCFKKYKNIRCIIDCTEVHVQSSGNFEAQGNQYSSYKGHTTYKFLVSLFKYASNSVFKKIVGSNNFSAQFIKIISHYKKIGYNINVLQQTACLVVNPITVGNFAFLFNCTPVGRTSDSMMVPT